MTPDCHSSRGKRPKGEDFPSAPGVSRDVSPRVGAPRDGSDGPSAGVVPALVLLAILAGLVAYAAIGG